MEAPSLVARNLLRTALLVLGVSVFATVLSMIVAGLREDSSFTHRAQATSTATTTVTVLNTPPLWTVYAQELFESSTTSPSNSGTTTSWIATATDSNGEDWYLLICKSSSTPSAGTSTAPSCGGGLSDRWGVSAATLSGSQATVSTTTTEAMPEVNEWYAYICDGNAGAPRCNGTMWNGDGSGTSSPFVVNHRPYITFAADTSPVDPGDQVDWTTTADDDDSIGGADTIRLHVCRAQDFNTTIPYACGVGGYWASSTFVTSNPIATTTIDIPTQDRDYPAYVYIIDEHNHPALVTTSPWHSSSTVLTVLNVAPYVSTSSIGIFDVFGTTTSDTNLVLTVPEGQTNNFVIEFDVNDDNSCLNASLGNEITGVDIMVYRSSVAGSYLCSYNANNCYTHVEPSWVPTCYQVPGTCAGASDTTATWECTFPLWFIADPTDGGSLYAADTWDGAARATDEGLTGPYSASTTNAEMTQFLSFSATGSPIAYGSFEPGFGNALHPATTTVYSTGNTGIDHYLSGDAMCPSYPACSGNATSTIYVPFQHYATSSSAVAYGSGFVLSTSTSPVLVGVDIRKPTATTTPTDCTVGGVACDDTYWGILVPGTITLAGDYIGRNYIDALVAPSSDW